MNVDKIYKINDEPLIFAGNGNCLSDLDKIMSKKKTIFLWHPSWRISLKTIPKLIRTAIKFKRNHKSKFIVCCNSKEELILCRLFSLNSHLLNQNMHECENEFVIKQVPKKYDAIYIAQARPFKRMYLANLIKDLFILTYGCQKCQNEEGNDLSKFDPSIKHAIWNKSFIHDRDKISELICESHAGLALSKREGAMWASVQYLLCGIPIVTTKSQGGRDYFYDSSYVQVVKDKDLNILQGVKNYIQNPVNPQSIRSVILDKIKKHRHDYLEVIKPFIIDFEEDKAYNHIWGGNKGIKKHLFEKK